MILKSLGKNNHCCQFVWWMMLKRGYIIEIKIVQNSHLCYDYHRQNVDEKNRKKFDSISNISSSYNEFVCFFEVSDLKLKKKNTNLMLMLKIYHTNCMYVCVCVCMTNDND